MRLHISCFGAQFWVFFIAKWSKYFFHHWLWGYRSYFPGHTTDKDPKLYESRKRSNYTDTVQGMQQSVSGTARISMKILCRMVHGVLVKSLCPHKARLLTEAKAIVYQLWVVAQVSGADTQIPTARRVAHCVEMSHEVLHDNVLMKIKCNSLVWPLFFIFFSPECCRGLARAAAEGIQLFPHNDRRHLVTGFTFLCFTPFVLVMLPISPIFSRLLWPWL